MDTSRAKGITISSPTCNPRINCKLLPPAVFCSFVCFLVGRILSTASIPLVEDKSGFHFLLESVLVIEFSRN